MANVAFKKGLLANLPNTYAEGTFYVTTDERAIYLDVSNSARVRIGDFQEFATVAALEANTNPSTTALYYVTAINCLAKWDGSKYVQINLDTGATSIEVVGEGNAVTGASYNAETRKITLTKGATYALDSTVTGILDGEDIDSFGDVETALAGKQDTIPENTYDAYGAASDVQDAVTGESTDASTEITLYGVKKYAQEQAAAVLGTNADAAGAATVYGANKAAAAAQAEAEAKVASVGATANKGIEIGGTGTAPTVGIKLSSKTGNALGFADGNGEDGGLFYQPAAAVVYSIAKDATSADYAAVYHLTADGVNTGVAINIPKDMVVESGEVVTNPEGKPAGTYIKLVLANATNDEIFINVGDLIEYVTGGTAADGMITVNVDGTTHVATATINDGTVTLAKLHADVQAEINKAHTHSNKALLDTYTQTEADLADAVTKKHAHANAAVLEGIDATDVSNWDGEIGANAAITAMKDGDDLDSFGDVEDALDLKAPLASPAMTGTPTAPTAAAGTNTTQVATTAFVKTAIDNGLTWGSF